MNKYEITRGEVVKEIEANNEREAIRRFSQEFPPTIMEPSNLPPTAKLLEEIKEPPVKKRYRVKWGELEREIPSAINEDDAWSQFIANDTDTEQYRFPNLHKRVIEELGPAAGSEQTEEDGKERLLEHAAASPVADLAADEAIDQIGRMRSADRLHEIVQSDQRVTVRHAAEKKLEELRGA